MGPEEALSLTDGDFSALGVDKIGDRARIREKCRQHVTGRFKMEFVGTTIKLAFKI